MPGDEFFLEPAQESNDVQFLPPPRDGTKVDPFVDGIATFEAMARDVASARASVYLTNWLFVPGTQLFDRSGVLWRRLRARGLAVAPRTWGALLGTMARSGVDVRVILADFDPILIPNQEWAWSAYCELVNESSRAKRGGGGSLRVMCSRHDAELFPLVPPLQQLASSLIRPRLQAYLDAVNGEPTLAQRRARLKTRPGVWALVALDQAGKRFVIAPDAKLSVVPGCHHQKTLVVDGSIGWCGGLDINPWRIDDEAHSSGALDATPRQRRERNEGPARCVNPWHDVQLRVEGEAAADLQRNFVGRWNREASWFQAAVDKAHARGPTLGVRLPKAAPLDIPMTAPSTGPRAAAGTARAQLVRTLSMWTDVGPAPRVLCDHVARSYELAIDHAESYVYLENQYVRDERVVDWLIERADDVPRLVVIVVVPVAPEEVNGDVDPVTALGVKLQYEALQRLKGELQERVGLYSMVVRSDAPIPLRADAYGRRQVYVHSKVLLVDDVYLNVGSSNASARSFEMDTEANYAVYDPTTARALRLRLWGELLGAPPDLRMWPATEFVTRWDAIAVANAHTPMRRGFVVPHTPLSLPDPPATGYIPNLYAGLTESDAPGDATLLA